MKVRKNKWCEKLIIERITEIIKLNLFNKFPTAKLIKNINFLIFPQFKGLASAISKAGGYNYFKKIFGYKACAENANIISGRIESKNMKSEDAYWMRFFICRWLYK